MFLYISCMKKKMIFNLVILTVSFLGIIPVMAAPPAWSASGDNFTANITFPSLAAQMKKAPVQEGSIESAELTRKDEKSIGAVIRLLVKNEQLKGTVCTVNTSIFIESVTLEKGVLRIQNSEVQSCQSSNRFLPNSVLVQAARAALAAMEKKIEEDMNQSLNKTLSKSVSIMKEQGHTDVKIDYSVYPEGLSVFVYSGEKN